MAIKLLDDHLINKIAAGEVIERPASVVKELVENAVDAGSRRISVQISGGGIEKIEVVDDGQGISQADVMLAFQRHATSKINNEDDLIKINSMGFRGEALPSIASVSRLELYTQYSGESGIRVVLDGGKNAVCEPFPTAPGTRVLVRDLFFNTPARRKFLKSPVSEAVQVHDLMCRLALARTDISFSYANEKKLYFKTPGNVILHDTVVAIYGNDFAANFIDLEWSGETYRINGLISRPEFRRLNRRHQVFFINNRLIKSPMLARAVDEGYRGTLLAREYPAVFLFLTVAPEDVDVNVHPQKTEVRFRDDKIVFRLVSQAIKARLTGSSFQGVPIITGAPAISSRYDLHPVRSHQWGRYENSQLLVAEEADQAFYQDNAATSGQILPGLDTGTTDHDFVVIGQCFEGYILVQQGDLLWLVDQHAAQERILFNRLQERGQKQTGQGQVLTFPQAMDLSSAAMDVLEKHLPVFKELGFEIEPIGPNAISLRAAPAALQGQEIPFINESLELMAADQPLDLKDKLYALMACKQAIKAGDCLSRAEMVMLINDLLHTPDFRNCPHGRPTLIEIKRQDIEKRFKRK